MIDVISGASIRHLAEVHEVPCVSIYLPTHPAGTERLQDPIRLKNALGKAGAELEALGVRQAEVGSLLAAATALKDDAAFWEHVDQGLAVFASPGGTSVYRLPVPVDDVVVVADRFHVKPLLPAVSAGEVFYVLALSANQVRLLRGSRFGVSELALGEIAESLAAALWFEDREAQLYSHAAGRVGRGDVAATFHGQGAGKDARGGDLDRFLAAVDAGVRHILADTSAPLVLAGVSDTVSHYRHVSSYAHLVDGSIEGNAQRSSPAELHDRAWPLVQPVFEEARRHATETFLADPDRSAGTLPEAVLAACDGRVATLFVPLRAERWGRCDPGARRVEEHDDRQPGDRDLFDVAVAETLANGGEVYALEDEDVPGDGPIAALLRF